MSRTVRRRTIREGRGIGEYLAEGFIYIVAIVGIVVAVRWYLVVYRHSPTPALSKFLGAIKSGDVDEQYAMLSAETKAKWFPTRSKYVSEFDSARGLTQRISNFDITMKEVGDRAEADVTLTIRESGQKLYQASSDAFKDKYVLLKEQGEWRIALDQTWDKIESRRAATRQ